MPSRLISGPRVVLRPTRFSDRGWLLELLTDDDIRKKTLQPVAAGVSAYLRAIAQTQDHRWVIEDRASGSAVGWILVGRLEPSPHIAVGFEVRRGFCNRGFATEAVKALLAHWFSDLSGPPALGGLVFVDNRASQRVFEKAGFEGRGPCSCQGHPCLMYEITAETWRAKEGSATS